MENLEVGDIVMCTVDKIMGTMVFVQIDETGKEASIIFSEISPGRIRNIRDFVVPKKKIICKVLRIIGNRIDLSLRRVTQKEQKEIKEQFKQEKSSKSILKTILGEKTKQIIETIEKKQNIIEFLEQSKQEPKILEEIVGKKDAEKILEILNTQKQKTATIKKEINLSTKQSKGITLIKKILSPIKDAEIKYISAGKYSIKTEGDNLKKADNKLKEILTEIEKNAKQNNIEFKIKEK